MILERKEVYNLNEYIQFICSWWGKEWEKEDIDNKELKKTHGIPNSYPAIVWIEENYDSEGMFSSILYKKVHIIDKETLIILRKKGYGE